MLSEEKLLHFTQELKNILVLGVVLYVDHIHKI